MAATTDIWGCPASGPADAVAAVEAATCDYVTMAPALDRHFPALEQAGPMGQSLLAQFLIQAHRPHLSARAEQLAAEAWSTASATTEVTNRERGQIQATRAWAAGDIDGAIDTCTALLDDFPTDLLALRVQHLLLFSAGRLAEMDDAVERVRPAWSDELPLHSRLDGMAAFAAEELGRYSEAEEVGRRGVEADETDLWALHSVAHVLEMQARRDEGIDWLSGRDDVLEAGGGFAGHLWWHLALQLRAAGRNDEALALLDRRVYPGESEEGLDLSNAISLLARLEIDGIDAGDRWDRLAPHAAVRLGQHSHPFNDTHFALALARAGRLDEAYALVEGMRRWAAERRDHAGKVIDTVGLATARAMIAFGRGQWAETVATIRPVADDIWRLGGSHAQRDLYRIVLATASDRAAA